MEELYEEHDVVSIGKYLPSNVLNYRKVNSTDCLVSANEHRTLIYWKLNHWLRYYNEIALVWMNF